MNGKSLSVGIVGAGSMGKNHVRVISLLKEFDLKIICDPNKDVLSEYSESLGIKTTSNILDLKDCCEAVIIASPTIHHLEAIISLAPYIKNFFVEKPMVSSLTEAITLKDTIKKHDLNLQVGFIERFNPAITALSELITSVGKIINLDFTRSNKVDRILDVDVVTDLMIHDIDLALFLNGPVKNISANGSIIKNSAEFCIATFEHENGSHSRLLASKVTNKKIRSIHLTTSECYVDCDLLKKEIYMHKSSDLIDSSDNFYRVESTSETIEVGYQEALLSELISFGKYCYNNKTRVPSFDDGLNALKIVEIIQSQLY
tara:strand:+ start:221 stop:1168 length:948 start_codon:yes stop_codon:yes gene_type:complete